VQDRYAYIVDNISNTLQIVDISNPASPVSVGSVATGGTPIAIDVKGHYAYVVNNTGNTLQVFDIGGAYVQQLEAGGIEAGSISILNNLNVDNNVNIGGAVSISNGLIVNGPFSLRDASSTILAKQIGLGTTSPGSILSVAGAVNGNTPVFMVSTSTASVNSTVFQIDQNGLLTINTPGATSTINGNLYVHGALRSTTSYNGDIIFANGFRFTEAPLDDTPQGLYLQNQNNQNIFAVDSAGNLTLSGDICSNGSSQCWGKSIANINQNLDSLASSTALSILSVQATTTKSLSDLSASFDTLSQSISNLSGRVDVLASTSITLSSLVQADTLASSTAASLATSTSFIQTIANAVQDLIQSTGNWIVNQVTAVTGVFTNLTATTATLNTANLNTANIQTLCVGSTCVTEAQLQQLLQKENVTAAVISTPVIATTTTATTTATTSVDITSSTTSTFTPDMIASSTVDIASSTAPVQSSTITTTSTPAIATSTDSNASTSTNASTTPVTSDSTTTPATSTSATIITPETPAVPASNSSTAVASTTGQ
jgi:hypothetical protein